MKTYKQDLNLQAPQPYPDSQYLHTIGAGVGLPLLQSVVTGVFFAVLVGLVTVWNKADDWAYWSALVGLVAGLVYWLVSQAIWRRLVRLVELAWQRDIDGDGSIGEPDPAPQTVRVEVTSRDGGSYSTDISNLPYPQKLPALAEGLLRGVSFAEGHWAGPGKLFTPNEYTVLKEAMLKQGFIQFRDKKAPKLGFILTNKGRALLRGIVGEIHPESKATPPLPSASDGWNVR